MKKYDICVIGGGPSGYAAAMRGIDFNKKVLLVEKDKLGGAGLYNGALSSKTFWELSKDIAAARANVKKYMGAKFDVTFKDVVKQVNAAMAYRKNQLESHVNKLHELHGDIFDFIKGTGKLKSAHEVLIKTPDGNEEIVYAENIVLATGSRPRKLPHIPIDEKIIVTSDGVESFDHFPESIVILGAGVIGCEWATIFSNFGYTKVNIIDKGDRILPAEDADLAAKIEQNLIDNGVNVHRNSQLVRMEIKNGRVEYELQYKDGHREIFNVEKALISVGRVANVENLGLEEVGVELLENGAIKNNDSRTSVPNIYAVGDLTADISLVNVGEMEGRHAVELMYLPNPPQLDYRNISTIMFLNPETAGVGMNESEARRRKIPYKVVTIDYSVIPRAIAMNNTNGFFKILVTNDDDIKILGMRAIGVHASSAIQAVALLIHMDKGIDELAELIHPHPSIIEGIQECLRALKHKSIMKPEVFTDMLRCRVVDENGNESDWKWL
ncbi:MAG: NAD(P)/FAD-dependent oxidoreductase [Cytophagaceae bacterium]|nr:NAD(P)/FAD-dependent oxidoreductase [Cytophagaceae bacterium]MDW8456661.1 NAD(P)/FAD-dependent oxidoreductase [Cytophagaceae bacterium]